MPRGQAHLPGISVQPAAGGPVYQGVARQFRALFPKDDADAQRLKEELSGWRALALSHARAIDAAPMPSVGRAQTSSELREALAAIAGAMGGGDAWDDFLEGLKDDGRAAPSHAPD